jgi:hypothetical protein
MLKKSESEREVDCSEAMYSTNPSNNVLLVLKLWFLAGCSKGQMHVVSVHHVKNCHI